MSAEDFHSSPIFVPRFVLFGSLLFPIVIGNQLAARVNGNPYVFTLIDLLHYENRISNFGRIESGSERAQNRQLPLLK